MIEINLLPEELHRRELPFFSNIGVENLKVWIGGCVLVSLALAVIFLPMLSYIRKSQSISLMAKEKGFSSKLSEIEKLSKEMSIINIRMKALGDLTKRSFLWTEKLNQLSDLILPGTWYSHVYTDAGDRLIIEGSVISKSEEEVASVGKFMKNIKENTEFFKDFKNIKLESVQRRSKNELDIVDFRIALYF